MTSRLKWLMVAVLALLLAYFTVFRSSKNSDAKKEAAKGSESPTAQGAAADHQSDSSKGASAQRDRPSLDDVPESNDLDDGYRTRVANDGRIVRDHREEVREFDPDAVLHAPKVASRVKPETLATLRQKVRPTVSECIRAAESGSAKDAHANAFLKVSIHEGTLTVDELSIESKGVADEAWLASCLTDRILGFQTQVNETNDVEGYKMKFPYKLGPRNTTLKKPIRRRSTAQPD